MVAFFELFLVLGHRTRADNFHDPVRGSFEFDEIVAKYGLEKLKTIGDSYMFVSGLPEAKPSHAVDAVRAAEALQRLAH